MSRRILKMVLLCGVAIGCGSNSGGTGTGGSAGGHAGTTATGGHATGGGSGGSAGAAGGHAGSAGGAAGGAAGGHAGSAGGAAGGAAGAAGGAAGGMAGSAGGMRGGAAGAGGADAAVMRGQYLVRSVLNCAGCHGANLAGTSCFVNNMPNTGDCLSSANLTNDATGLKNLTDQQIKDALTKGKDPDQAGSYLFSRMPYYQFANLTDSDANAIVAYLRTVPGVANTPTANAGTYATQPTAPQNAPVNPSDLPNGGSAAGTANGKYLATLACVTCHTVDLANETPTIIDAAKAFQGGRLLTVGATTVQTSNLTPDATGIMGWAASDVATAIQTDKDKTGKTICVMRALPNMTDSDATDIGTYLTSIPAVANSITMLCP